MIRPVAIYLLIFCTLNAQAQDKPAAKKTVIAVEAGAHGIGLGMEWNAAGIFTVETYASYGPSYDPEQFEWLPVLNVLPHYDKPAARFAINPRFYITRQNEREGASANVHHIEQYIGFSYAFVTRSFSNYNPPATLLSLHYGIRQQASSRLIFTASGGIGWARNNKTTFTTLYPALNVKVGYMLN
ncbi:MAG: hypothetical protein WCF67_21365 [Chitinophagaceae bacterium]